MEEVSRVAAQHKDLIHDVSHDYYGRRMATCSSDHTVKVWDLGEDGKTWQETAAFKAHSGSVWKVVWAHPEFGQVLVTCSFDYTCIVWEEQDSGSRGKGPAWVERAKLCDSRAPVTDIKFAPRHSGLKLATCSEDGVVRLYEAMDIMNLSSWSQMADFKPRGKAKCTCISWNPSRLSNAMLAVGLSASDACTVQIWESEDNRRWTMLDLRELAHIQHGVLDIAFAPNVGRSYHLVAAALEDRSLRIWKLSVAKTSPAPEPYLCEEVLNTTDARDSVWRISWNVTGTILAASLDNSTVALWHADQEGGWRKSSVIKGETAMRT